MRYALLLLLTVGLACSKAEPPAPSTTETSPREATAKPSAPGAKPSADAAPAAEGERANAEAAPSEPAGDDAARVADSFADALPQPGAPTIELVEAGKAPMQTLSWKFKKGSKVAAKIDTEMSVTMLAGTRSTPETSAPTLSFEVSLETVDVSSDGSAQVAFKLLDGQVARDSAHEVLVERQIVALQSLEGLSGTYSVDPNGTISDIAFDGEVPAPGAEIADDFKRVLRLTTIPVPSEEVGVGAKWTVEQVVEQGGVRLRERRMYKISELDGSRVALDVAVQTKAPPQTVRVPGSRGPNQKYELLGYKAEGSEELRIDLTQLAPKSRSTKVVTTQRMSPGEQAAAAGSPVTSKAMQLKLHVNTTMTQK